MGRFVVPAMPFLALVFAALAGAAARSPHPRTVLGGLSAAVLVCSMLSIHDASPVPDAWRQRVHFRWNAPLASSEYQVWQGMRDRGERWGRVGRALALYARPGTPMYLPALGAISYYTEVHALDPFGLISPEIAEHSSSGRLRSPGHDRFVPPSFFTSPAPVYLKAWIAPADEPPEAGLPAVYVELMRESGAWIERLELPLGSEFQPGEELRVLHMPQADGAR